MFTIGGTSNRGFYPFEPTGSLRFEDGDSPYLTRTPTTNGNRKTWTFSAWVKLGNLGITFPLLGSGTNNQNQSCIFISSSDELGFIFETGNSGSQLTANAKLRDPSAWYHIVGVADTTQATASDRMKLYVNGVEQTYSFSSYPSQNFEGTINSTSYKTYIGKFRDDNTTGADGYMAEIYLIDGQALDPTDFAETKNGVWVPKDAKDSLTFGTNGFYLPFDDSSAIGDDESGNTNDFTTSGLAATDVVLDSPTNNFCTMNPNDKNSNMALSEGNLKALTSSSADLYGGFATHHMESGKWYAEFRVDSLGGSSFPTIGVAKSDDYPSNHTTPISVNVKSGATENYGTSGTSIDTFANGDILGIAFDADNGRIYFSKNGTFGQSQNPAAGTGAIFTGLTNSAGYKFGIASFSSRHAIANFGQDSTFASNRSAGGNADENGVGDFAYSPPSGFLALCTANLPEPDISPANGEEPEDYFNTVTYTGTGATMSVTGYGFGPEFLWLKRRSIAGDHGLMDIIRGAGNRLQSNSTSAEDAFGVTSFDSDGFTTNGSTYADSGETLVGWGWLAGGTAVSNTDGSITSSVSANTKAGFSIITYSGAGTSGSPTGTIGHGLDDAPKLLIFKGRSGDYATDNWVTWHGALATDKYLELNDTQAAATAGGNEFIGDTAPTTSVITVGSNSGSGWVNDTGTDYVCYAFAEIEGYSKIGSYTGNGSSDGAYVHCGFRPAWVLIKQSDAGRNWCLLDNKRDTFNEADQNLLPNSNVAEFSSTTVDMDFLSNGFKLRNSHIEGNSSGNSYIFIAFAEMPFKYAQAR